jgi:hypothetical protein
MQHKADHCYAKCQLCCVSYAECHIQALYAECRYAECRGENIRLGQLKAIKQASLLHIIGSCYGKEFYM